MRRMLAVTVCSLVWSTTAAAQVPMMPEQTDVDFRRLRLKLGETITVTDADAGVTVSGPLKWLTADRMEVGDYTVEPKPRMKIQREGDTIIDGAAIGFLVGGLVGVGPGAEACLHGSKAPCFFAGGLVYGLLGALLDWNHVGKTVVFRGSDTARGRRPVVTSDPPLDPAAAPSIDFTKLPLKRGDTVAVIRNSGTTVEGRLTSVGAGTLGIDGVTLESNSIIRVDQVGDPIWNGLAMGAAFGALMAIPSRATLRGGTITAAIFSAIGGAIDQAIVERKTVYGGASASGRRTVRVLPMIDRHQQSVALSLAF